MKNFQVLIILSFGIAMFILGSSIMAFSSNRSPLKYGYSKDKDAVYFKNKPIKNSDPNTFVSLDYRYAKDSNQAYYLSHSGDPNIYKDKLLGELHGMLFPKYTLNIIDNADSKTFKSLPYDSGNAMWALDKNHVYWCGQLFENADAGSFEIINGPGLFAKDKLHFYDSCGYWPTVLKALPKPKTPSMYPHEDD